MKIAVIISGHVRTWENTKESFIKTFSDLSPDVFVTTYNKQYGYHPYIRGVTGYHDDVILNDEYITKLFKNVGVKTYVDITDSDMMDSYIKQQMMTIHPDMRNMESSLAQFYKLQHAVNSIIDIEKENDFKYDCIIKTRCDLLYEEDLEFSVGSNQVLIDNCNVFPNDCFIMANHDDFIRISNFMVDEFYKFSNPTSSEKPPHTLLLNAFNSVGVEIISKKIMKSVMRINGEQKY
jgi:hypothetical protein